jgi:hypothetical protein
MSVPPKTAYPWQRWGFALALAWLAGAAAGESTAASRSAAKAQAKAPNVRSAERASSGSPALWTAEGF